MLLTLVVACNRTPQTKEAVRQGVINHLTGRSGLDVSSMDVEVASVSFRGDEADALVSFRPKGSSDPASGMQMRYTLEAKAGKWVVKTKAEGGSPHAGDAQPGSEALPPGHPPVPQEKPPAKNQP